MRLPQRQHFSERALAALLFPEHPMHLVRPSGRTMSGCITGFTKSCALVEVDKSRPEKLKGRQEISINGKPHKVDCVRHLMNGSKKELVQCFFDSAEYKQWKTDNPGETLGESSVQRCICPCIKPAKLNECACKICVEFQYGLKAWNDQRKDWHKSEKCTCYGCTSKQFGLYMGASASESAFRAACCCPKVERPHLTLPHLPDSTPAFYQLKCCKASNSTPNHIDTCRECGWHNNRRLYKYGGCIERNDEPATWMQWQDTEANENTRSVPRGKKGTRKQLLDHVFSLHRKYLFHKWVHW